LEWLCLTQELHHLRSVSAQNKASKRPTAALEKEQKEKIDKCRAACVAQIATLPVNEDATTTMQKFKFEQVSTQGTPFAVLAHFLRAAHCGSQERGSVINKINSFYKKVFEIVRFCSSKSPPSLRATVISIIETVETLAVGKKQAKETATKKADSKEKARVKKFKRKNDGCGFSVLFGDDFAPVLIDDFGHRKTPNAGEQRRRTAAATAGAITGSFLSRFRRIWTDVRSILKQAAGCSAPRPRPMAPLRTLTAGYRLRVMTMNSGSPLMPHWSHVGAAPMNPPVRFGGHF